jgi:ATP-binding cassette, subfamily B, bacterial
VTGTSDPTTIVDLTVTVRSRVEGRCRLDLPALLGRPALARSLAHLLAAEPGILQVDANPVTGRVLFYHRPDLSGDRLLELVYRRVPELIRAAVVRPPALPEETPKAARSKVDLRPLVRMLELTKNQRRRQIFTLLVAFVDRLFEAAPPAQIGAAVDVVTRRNKSFLSTVGIKTVPAQLAALGAGSLVVWSADTGMGYLHQTTSARLAEITRIDLRTMLYDKLQSLDAGEVEQRTVDEWMDLLDSDVSRIADFIETGLDPIVIMAANGLIVTGTFLVNSPLLLAIQLLILPGLYFVSRALLGPIRERAILAIEAKGRVNSSIADNLSGYSTIAVFGREEYEANRIRLQGEESMEASRRRTAVGAAFVPSIQMLVGLGFIATLVAGGMLVAKNKLKVSMFNVMAFSSLRLLVALSGLGGSLQRYQQASVSFERVLEFMDRAPSKQIPAMPAPFPETPGDIEFDGVSFGYTPEHKVLDALSLRIRAGKTTGIVGYSGAGKTTLLKLLLRFREVAAGAIRIGGTDIRAFHPHDLRAAMAIVPQAIYLFNGTVRENIAWSRPGASLDEVREAAQIAQAEEFVEELPESWDTGIGSDRSAPLSVGQRQRVAIARAVLAGRPILLFDEATSGMDYETEAAVQRALHQHTAGRTTVLVAHRLATLRQADNIYVLNEGAVAEQGTHDELLAQGGIYARLWRIQTGEAPEALPAPDRSPENSPPEVPAQ